MAHLAVSNRSVKTSLPGASRRHACCWPTQRWTRAPCPAEVCSRRSAKRNNQQPYASAEEPRQLGVATTHRNRSPKERRSALSTVDSLCRLARRPRIPRRSTYNDRRGTTPSNVPRTSITEPLALTTAEPQRTIVEACTPWRRSCARRRSHGHRTASSCWCGRACRTSRSPPRSGTIPPRVRRWTRFPGGRSPGGHNQPGYSSGRVIKMLPDWTLLQRIPRNLLLKQLGPPSL